MKKRRGLAAPNWRNVFYTVMILALVGSFGYAIVRSIAAADATERQGYASFPAMNWEQLNKEMQRLEPIVKRGLKNSVEYFDVLYKIRSLQGSVQRAKYIAREKMLDPRYPVMDDLEVRRVLDDPWTAQPNLDRLIKDEGWEQFKRARDAAEPRDLSHLRGDPNTKPWSWYDFLCSTYHAARPWIIAQLVGSLFMFFHLWILTRDEGGSYFLEIAGNGPKLALAILFWEWGLAKYEITDPARQFAQAARLVLQLASFVIAAALSLFTVGGGKMAKASSLSEDDRSDNPEIAIVHNVHYTVSTLVLPAYLGFLDGGIFHNGAVQFTELNVSGKHWFFDFWNSTALGRQAAKPNYGFENDYAVGYADTLNRGLFRRRIFQRLNLQYNVSCTFLDVYPLFKLPRGDVVNISAFVGRKFSFDGEQEESRSSTAVKPASSDRPASRQSIMPYLWVRRALPAKGSLPKGGTFTLIGGRYSNDLASRLNLGVDVSANHDTGAFGFNEGWIARASAAFNWKFGKHLTVQAPFFQTSAPMTHTADGRKFHFLTGIGMSYAW